MKEYFYIDVNGNQVGPRQLSDLIGVINLDTMVWTTDLTDWVPARNVAELADALNAYQTQQNANQQQQMNQQQPPYQQPYQRRPAPGPKPDNYLVLSIISVFFCCLPLSIAAIIYAIKVDEHWSKGEYESAYDASGKAKKLLIWSAIATAALTILCIVFYIFVFVLAIGTAGLAAL
ncbi:MAG: CD225/dispanin family protein [Bacteroidales bacterium]|nr:CD225/dispanin family protein [Bacteroidales bacterium]MDD6140519.1 CD225/dispanin family protein [Bacteroidales bacterium]